MGESGYKELQDQVHGLEAQAKENSKVVNAIASLILGYGYGSYKQPTAGSLAQPPSKIGDISVDNVFDIPNDGMMRTVNFPVRIASNEQVSSYLDVISCSECGGAKNSHKNGGI